MFRFLLVSILLLFTVSCSSNKKQEIKNAASAYSKAMKILKDKRYIEAAEKLEAIYDDYPVSKWSIKAQAIAAYAYYAEENYDDVIRVSETFLQLNPANEYVPYMQYMKAISYYNLIPNVDRGQNYTRKASYDFRELVARFPTSIYAEDARKKINIIQGRLAASKMSIGRYQMHIENYVGAIIHFNDVIYRYSNTKVAPEAYFRLYEIYYKLGMKKQAAGIKREMKKSFSDSSWYDELKKIKL